MIRSRGIHAEDNHRISSLNQGQHMDCRYTPLGGGQCTVKRVKFTGNSGNEFDDGRSTSTPSVTVDHTEPNGTDSSKDLADILDGGQCRWDATLRKSNIEHWKTL